VSKIWILEIALQIFSKVIKNFRVLTISYTGVQGICPFQKSINHSLKEIPKRYQVQYSPSRVSNNNIYNIKTNTIFHAPILHSVDTSTMPKSIQQLFLSLLFRSISKRRIYFFQPIIMDVDLLALMDLEEPATIRVSVLAEAAKRERVLNKYIPDY
jgi:hypothetical protein